MNVPRRSCVLLALLTAPLMTAPLLGADRIGDIEFFGYKGLDIAGIRNALPLKEGDAYTEETKAAIRQAVSAALGKAPTDVAAICCDEQGNRLLFIGLPGASSKSFAYHPEPQGEQRLAPDIMDLYSRLDPAIEAAVRKGGGAAEEDDSNGYALIQDPAARSLQLAVHDWAVQHEAELLRVLESSSAVEHRRVASDALGYARQSRQQILALVAAARDRDDDVRNNATRALGVLVRSKPALAAQIPPDTFIEMLNSGVWSDRNKSAGLLAQLTDQADPALLGKLRSLALDSLLEMAAWRQPGHAYFSRMLLGRVAGLPEDRLHDLAWNGPIEVIIEAAGGRP
jgi:hypothetical protein